MGNILRKAFIRMREEGRQLTTQGIVKAVIERMEDDTIDSMFPLEAENSNERKLTIAAPAGAKGIYASGNEFELSGLLNTPDSIDGWFEVIDTMTKDFFSKENKMPTKTQAWAQLCDNPPTGYAIEISKDKQSLTIPGFIKPLNKRSFDRRWAKYTAKLRHL